MKNYQISEELINRILTVLGQLPFHQVNVLINDISKGVVELPDMPQVNVEMVPNKPKVIDAKAIEKVAS